MLLGEKFKRLDKAIEWSQRQLEFPRRKRVEAVKYLVGYHYNENGTPRKEPINLIKLAVQIYVQALAARAPRVLISTSIPELKSTAANLELAVNRIPSEIMLGETLRRFVMEALFSMGIVKVGLYTVGKKLGHNYGQPFVDIVTLDDYIVDMSAKTWDQIQFEGNDFWLTHKQTQKLGWGDKLTPGDDEETTIGERGEQRAEGIVTSGTSVESYKRRIWLRDIWLPHDGLLVTYSVRSKKILNITEWDGPQYGPYSKLGFTDVPGNLLPLSPVAVWRDLHELANVLFRKLGTGADDYKACLGFGGDDQEAVQNFKKAKHGDGIRYSGPDPRKLEAGGVDAKTLAFFMQCRDLSSYFAGNLDALGGLGPMAETLGQDKLLSEAAGAQLRDMQGKTIATVREVFRALAWYEWHDPLKTRTLAKPVPGLPGMTIPVMWTRESRQGSFNEYDLAIDVYSLIDDSPSLKLQRLGIIMQQYVLPLLPAIQEQGGNVDVQAILNLVAKYADFDELKDIVTFASPEESAMGQRRQSARGPSETTRRYERVSRPGATPHGKSDAMQRMLLGEKLQEGEAAVLG